MNNDESMAEIDFAVPSAQAPALDGLTLPASRDWSRGVNPSQATQIKR
jgi:hypothetical protein